MRVGLIIYGSINTITGGFIYDYKLVEYLQSKGVLVKIFSQKQKNIFGLIRNNFSRKLIKEIIEFSPDILLEDEMNFMSLFLLNKKLKKIAGFPIISIVHVLQSNLQQNFFSQSITKKFEQAYLNSITGFIFNSFATEKTVLNINRKNYNSLVAYPGKDRIPFNITLDEISFKYQNDKLLIIFMGNLFYNKGLHVLLQSLSKIDKNLWQLSIVGNLQVDLNYSKKILKMIDVLSLKNNIKLFGELNPDNLREILPKHHVLVIPSYYESYGIAYGEAMGAGLPVIASRNGGTHEIVMDNVNGFLITPGDCSMLRDRIYKLIQDRELLKKMSNSSLSIYQKMPSWNETMAKVYAFLYQNHIKQ